jgi:hypothetical protein
MKKCVTKGYWMSKVGCGTIHGPFVPLELAEVHADAMMEVFLAARAWHKARPDQVTKAKRYQAACNRLERAMSTLKEVTTPLKKPKPKIPSSTDRDWAEVEDRG